MRPVTKHKTPTHWRFCGTTNPDQFLLETAYRFVNDFIGHVPPDAKFQKTVVHLPGRKTAPRRARPGAGELWIHMFSKYEGDECIVFPFSTAASPRGNVTFNFKQMDAHRAMCLKVNKLPPDPKMMALHTCGNGHLGCCTPKHLYWGDASSNAKDTHRHRIEGKPSCERSNPLRRSKVA
ncbi:hypothetical protein B9J07_12995 [Sinorhizobium sp. LM21]|uniref:HNH endonuclease n=1 Tax=Sinorhizobium phage phiLM21 TaxID=1524882 RepID=UPI0004E5C031|nr:HNH endonuclease [Sinorhizobium phage phiLM21]AII27787.1 HNH endonuclease [Sinorhizobium phage phiLM21]OWZ93553.1 hypothetical protein B9J07_12995 [Sinorhizobium sp. LM21]